MKKLWAIAAAVLIVGLPGVSANATPDSTTSTTVCTQEQAATQISCPQNADSASLNKTNVPDLRGQIPPPDSASLNKTNVPDQRGQLPLPAMPVCPNGVPAVGTINDPQCPASAPPPTTSQPAAGLSVVPAPPTASSAAPAVPTAQPAKPVVANIALTG